MACQPSILLWNLRVEIIDSSDGSSIRAKGSNRRRQLYCRLQFQIVWTWFQLPLQLLGLGSQYYWHALHRILPLDSRESFQKRWTWHQFLLHKDSSIVLVQNTLCHVLHQYVWSGLIYWNADRLQLEQDNWLCWCCFCYFTPNRNSNGIDQILENGHWKQKITRRKSNRPFSSIQRYVDQWSEWR